MAKGWHVVAGGGRKNADPAIVAVLAGGGTVEEAAKQASVSVRTVHRRMNEPTFRRQLDEARSELVRRAVGMLARTSSAAATTLALLLKADSETVRLGAARAVLELGAKMRESDELERRLSELEERVGAQAGPGARRWACRDTRGRVPPWRCGIVGMRERVGRLEAALPDPVRAEAKRIGAEYGMSADEVLAEAEQLADRYGTIDQIVAGLAAEYGVSEEQVRQQAGVFA